MRILALLFLTLTLSACGTLDSLSDVVNGAAEAIFGEDNTEPPAELTDYKAELEIETLWKESVGKGPGEKYLKLRPAVNDSTIYAADHRGQVSALNRFNGDTKWEVDTDLSLSSGPEISERSVILASSKGEVIALNSENGSTLWKTFVSSEVLSTPLIAKGMVIIRANDGRIFAFSESDGHKLWDFDRNVPALSLRGSSKPAVQDDILIAGFDNGKLIALRLKDGKQIWEQSVVIPQGRSEVERIVDLDVDPLISKSGEIYVAGYHGGVSALLIRNGEPLWRSSEEISSYAGMSMDDRYLYLSDSVSDVWQLDLRSGSSLWKQKDLHQRKLTAAEVYEDFVVVGDLEGYVHWLSVHDGRLLGRTQIASEAIDNAPVIYQDMVYVYAKDGTLAALKAK